MASSYPAPSPRQYLLERNSCQSLILCYCFCPLYRRRLANSSDANMIRALRTPLLGRQTFAAGRATATMPSSLHRLASQAWKNSSAARIASTRSVQTAAQGATNAGLAGRLASLRSQLTWRNFATGSTGRLLSRTQKRNFNWSWSRRSRAGEAKAEEPLSLSGRLKKLSREYGWSAAGVYLGLSILDFPFCFLLVKWAGTERIGKPPYSRQRLVSI